MERKRCRNAVRGQLFNRCARNCIFGNNPGVTASVVEEGQFKIKGYDGPVVECDKCGADMHLKLGRFGKYGVHKCDNTRKILKNGEVAPPKEDQSIPELKCEKSDAYFVLRDGASGVFMSAHNFPKSRETRPAKCRNWHNIVIIAGKTAALADAPQQDPEGNPTVIRFSRKRETPIC